MNERSNQSLIEAKAPTRIDLGGGWTDVPPFSDDEGGFVCNIAIDRYATATVRSAPESTSGPRNEGESALASAALRRARMSDSARNISLDLSSDFPVGAGLGGSSAAGVASLGALLAWQGIDRSRSDIAELSRTVEVEDLRVPGGRQDHYAASFGGALGLTFVRAATSTGQERTAPVLIERIPLSHTLREEIERRFVLLYTGQSRISGATISAVLNAYIARDPSVCSALRSMRELARNIAGFIASGSIDALALAVAEQWEHQRSLHPLITTELIDHSMSLAARSGAIGAKALGASGGGSVLFIARSGDEEKLRESLRGIGEVLPFRIDLGGLTVRRIDSSQ